MLAYKMVRIRKDGSLGPLFINRRQRYPLNQWLDAENHPTKGYALRPGFHCCAQPVAPHLSFGPERVWVEVLIEDYYEHQRSVHQGGLWFLANRMKILRIL